MPTEFVSFKHVLPNQIFEIHEQEWIKCHATMVFEDIKYNAFEFNSSLTVGQRLMIDVRCFDEATLVRIDVKRPLFQNRIEPVRLCDNDN